MGQPSPWISTLLGPETTTEQGVVYWCHAHRHRAAPPARAITSFVPGSMVMRAGALDHGMPTKGQCQPAVGGMKWAQHSWQEQVPACGAASDAPGASGCQLLRAHQYCEAGEHPRPLRPP